MYSMTKWMGNGASKPEWPASVYTLNVYISMYWHPTALYPIVHRPQTWRCPLPLGCPCGTACCRPHLLSLGACPGMPAFSSCLGLIRCLTRCMWYTQPSRKLPIGHSQVVVIVKKHAEWWLTFKWWWNKNRVCETNIQCALWLNAWFRSNGRARCC